MWILLTCAIYLNKPALSMHEADGVDLIGEELLFVQLIRVRQFVQND